MYRILTDGALFSDSRVEDLAIIDPKISLEANKAGSFTFTIPHTHPYFGWVTKRKTIIEVYRDDETEPLFEGIATELEDDFYLQRSVVCEGELSFFNDTIQRPARYQGVTVRQLLEAYVNIHNSLCEDSKHFTIGQVTVEDPNDYLYCYTNYDTTMTALNDDLVENLGGYFRVRHEDGVRYLDYLAESPHINTQMIALGENLIDFTSTLDTSEIATVVIPLGAVLDEEQRTSEAIEGLDERLTIKSVNDGKDYLENTDAINSLGRIEQIVEWDDVTTASALKTKGEKYLSETQFDDVVIEAQAIDLHIDSKTVESFKILDQIRVVSAPHGLDKYFMLSKITYNLNNPENDTVTLGIEEHHSLSSATKSANSEVMKRIEQTPTSTFMNSAIANATALISGNNGGHIKIVKDDNGQPTEILIMDTDSEDTALKVWRWNQSGLGYASREQASDPLTYGLAMTADGAIVADYITSGKMSASRIQGDTLTLGGANNVNGKLNIVNIDGNTIGTWDKDGINITSGKLTGIIITGSQINANGLEVYGDDGIGRPYIDFHYDGSASDYTARILEQPAGKMIAYNSISNVSDERLKKDIVPLDDRFVQLIDKLTPKQYRYKKGDELLNLGFIAQDVDKAMDELGITDKPIVFNDGTEEGFYSLDYNQITPILWRKIQMLEEKINKEA